MAEDTQQEGQEEAQEPAKEAAPAQSGGKLMLIVVLVFVLAGFGAVFFYLDGKVQIRAKDLDRIWAEKQQDLRSMARQRMYDSSQSHLQTEMMDRWRNTGRGATANTP